MNKKNVFSLLLIMLIFALFIAGCSNDSDGKKSKKSESDGHLVVALTGEADSIDPHNDSNTLARQTYSVVLETLVALDENSKIVPRLAKDWNVSDDGKVWTFELEEGVEFHDGEPFNAEAVKTSFDRVTNEENKMSQYHLLGPYVESIEVTGEYEVVFNLHEPLGPFLHTLAFPTGAGIISPKTIEEGDEVVAKKPVGTGPYKLENWSPGSDTIYVANENYWGDEPKLEKLTFKFIPENASRVIMLETGEVDVIYDLPATDIERLTEDESINVVTTELNRTLYVGINNSFEPFKSKEVRQALNLAVNKETLTNDLYNGLVRPSKAAVSEKNDFYSDVGSYEYDLEKAKQLVEDAGVEPGTKIRLVVAGNATRDHRAGEFVQTSLNELGFDVELQLLELNQYLEALDNPEKYELFLRGGISYTNDASYVLDTALLSTASANYAHYENLEVDQLIQEGFVESDEEKRTEIYKEALEQIKEDAPWIFLYEDSGHVGMNKDVEGLVILPSNLWDFKNVSK